MTQTICGICYARRKSPPFAQGCAIVPVKPIPTRPGQSLHACEICREVLDFEPARKP